MPSEGSDTYLGARCREFESPHSDQNSLKSDDFRGFFLFFDYSVLKVDMPDVHKAQAICFDYTCSQIRKCVDTILV